MAGLDEAGAGRIIGACPTMLMVVVIAQGVEVSPPIRRGRVVAVAGGEIDAGHQHMHMHPSVGIPMQHGGTAVLIGLHSGEGHGVEVVENGLDLVGRRRIAGGPGDYRAAISPLEREAVSHDGCTIKVAAQDADLTARCTVMVCGRGEVVGGSSGASGAVPKPFQMHYSPRVVLGGRKKERCRAGGRSRPGRPVPAQRSPPICSGCTTWRSG